MSVVGTLLLQIGEVGQKFDKKKFASLDEGEVPHEAEDFNEDVMGLSQVTKVNFVKYNLCRLNRPFIVNLSRCYITFTKKMVL